MKVKNVSPLGDLVVPALGITVAAGQTADVPEAAALSLLEQPANWQPADGKAAKPPAQSPPTPGAPAVPAA